MRTLKISVALLLTLILGSYLWQRPTYDFDHDWPRPEVPAAMTDFQERYVEDRYYRGALGTRNYYAHYKNPKATTDKSLIIITGLEDITENWWQVSKTFFDKGYARVFVIEIRGQGKSSRVPGNSIRASHVNSFENYIRDLLYCLEDISRNWPTKAPKPQYIAHSTGGLVFLSSLKAIKADFPQLYPEQAALWTPFLNAEISGWLKHDITLAAFSLFDLIAQNYGLIFLGRRFPMDRAAENNITHDTEKFLLSESLRLYQGNNSIGVSLRWAIEAVNQTKKLAAAQYEMIDIPILILTAEEDKVVDNSYQWENSYVQWYEVQGAMHALHIEKDIIFKKALEKTTTFFREGRGQR